MPRLEVEERAQPHGSRQAEEEPEREGGRLLQRPYFNSQEREDDGAWMRRGASSSSSTPGLFSVGGAGIGAGAHESKGKLLASPFFEC